MRNKRKYQKFDKAEFEKILWEISPVVEFFGNFYKFDWIEEDGEWVQKPGEINEYCYFLALEGEVCLKVYSSIQKIENTSRTAGDDAIRIVAANTTDAKPIRPKFPKVYRTGNWRKNLKLRASQAVESLGANIICPKCKKRLLLKRNSKNNSQFLGCSNYPKCDYGRKFSL
jgi:hypothetical protein